MYPCVYLYASIYPYTCEYAYYMYACIEEYAFINPYTDEDAYIY
jgi:hypothetical protein